MRVSTLRFAVSPHLWIARQRHSLAFCLVAKHRSYLPTQIDNHLASSPTSNFGCTHRYLRMSNVATFGTRVDKHVTGAQTFACTTSLMRVPSACHQPQSQPSSTASSSSLMIIERRRYDLTRTYLVTEVDCKQNTCLRRLEAWCSSCQLMTDLG